MPRVKKPASERLTDSINVPLPRPLKRRVVALARALPQPVPPTRLARKYIEEGIARDEQERQQADQPELAAAS